MAIHRLRAVEAVMGRSGEWKGAAALQGVRDSSSKSMSRVDNDGFVSTRKQNNHSANRIASNATPNDVSVLLTPRELAARWKISEKKLENDRWRGKGLPFLRIGSCVRYRLRDIIEFENAHLVHSTSAP